VAKSCGGRESERCQAVARVKGVGRQRTVWRRNGLIARPGWFDHVANWSTRKVKSAIDCH